VDGREKMWITLNYEFLKKWEKKALKKAEEEGLFDTTVTSAGTEIDKKRLLFDELQTTVEIYEIKDDGIRVSIDNALGSFIVTIPLSIEEQLELLKANITRFNKIKAVMEATK